MPRLQFNLRFLLLWVIPYAALAALIASVPGPCQIELVNWLAKLNGMIFLAGCAIGLRHAIRRWRPFAKSTGCSSAPSAPLRELCSILRTKA